MTAGGGGGSSAVDVQHFTGAGVHNWTKPDGAKFVRVVCIGSGAGGSGMPELTGADLVALWGGSGAGVSSAFLLADDLPPTVQITVPAGGAGGTQHTGGGTGPGGAGGAGAPAIFGDEIQALGGNTNTPTGGSPVAGGLGLDANGGDNGVSDSSGGFTPTPNPTFGAGSGANGGNFDSPVTYWPGKDGGYQSMRPGSAAETGIGGASADPNGANATSAAAAPLGVPGAGGGGGGTGNNASGTPGNGGNGATGGGGGAAGAKLQGADPPTPVDAGAGGDGSVSIFTML